MFIKHVNGTYWNSDNECFAPIQAATDYPDAESMPDHILDNNGDILEKITHCVESVMFYPEHDDYLSAVASAEMTRQELYNGEKTTCSDR